MEVFADDLQGEVEGLGGVLVAEVQASDERFGVLALFAQARLLVIEELAADAVFVVHVQELSFLLLDLCKHALAAIDLLSGGAQTLAKILCDGTSDLVALGAAESDGGVVALDGGFDQIDGHVALGALAALVLGADEVFVGAAVALVAGVGQSGAADAAADRALERVLVLAVTLAGVPVRCEHGLNLVEELLADERLVSAGVVLGAVGDDAGVVGVGEQLVDASEVQCSRAVATVAARA